MGSSQRADALVLVNWASAGRKEGYEAVLPYLEHFGVPYTLLDLAHAPLPADISSYALIVIAHRAIDPWGVYLRPSDRERLVFAVRAGTGLVSFDPTLLCDGLFVSRGPRTPVTQVEFQNIAHYITCRHQPGEVLPLLQPMPIPNLVVERKEFVLVAAHDKPLVVAAPLGDGRVVYWTTAHWMHTSVLGPLAGMDDVLWRSIVWAARKPFVMRGLPPLVTMRVDDVSGIGYLWGQSPLYWVHLANRYGFKPWLGLFIYNLIPRAVNELGDLLSSGKATAFPHAFGRPARPGMGEVFYYAGHDSLGQGATQSAKSDEWAEGAHEHVINPQQETVWAIDQDEFIYFNHYRARPWPDTEAARRLRAVDDWYAARPALPMSRVFCPHWYEAGVNTIPYISDRWQCDCAMIGGQIGRPFDVRNPWLQAGPFRRYEVPGTAFIVPERRGQRPIYYADFVNLDGRRFFDCLTEIRDDAGYEWRPDNDLVGTVGRGVRQLRRALDSMALAVLFTHETDYICRIAPDVWAEEIARIAAQVADADPLYVTLDEGIRIVRTTKTSRLVSAWVDRGTGELEVHLEGFADRSSYFYLFSEEGEEIKAQLVEVPPFAQSYTLSLAHPAVG